MEWQCLEGCAAELVTACGAGDLPSPVRAIARSWGLRLVADSSVRRGALGLHEIRFNPHDTPQRQRFTVAHELAHWALARSGEACGGRIEEKRAHYIAGAVLLPRCATISALRRHGHDWAPVVELAAVSWEVFARRWVQLYDGIVSIYDDGKRTARITSPWLSKRRECELERRLRTSAHESRKTVHTGRMSAAYVVDGARFRVITAVARDEQRGSDAPSSGLYSATL